MHTRRGIAPAFARAVKPNASRLLRAIHKRALVAAMRAAGGDAEHAAMALGITVAELLAVLEGDPASLWSADGSRRAISGMRPKIDPPPREAGDEERPGDDDPDGSAW